MKAIHIIFLMFVCLALFSSCSKDKDDDSSPSNNSSSVFPFVKENNTWVYDFRIDGGSSATISYKIKSIDDEKFCHLDFVNPFGNITDEEYLWYADDEFFADETGAFADDWFPLLYKNNTVGKKWKASHEDEELGTIWREITSTSETVTVPAGNFTNCVKIKQTYSADAKIIDYYWVSFQAGIVKREVTGWADIEDESRNYFGIDYQLKSKSF